MKKIFLFTVLLFFMFSFIGVKAQHSVMRTPGKYLMPMDNASEAFSGASNKEGELWVVYSDRPENPVYSDRSCKKPTGSKLDFMQAMYVIDENESSIEIIPVDEADVRGNLKDGASEKSVWITKDKMLLWRNCLKTRDVNLPEFKDGIFNKKAMVLNIISDTQQEIRVPEYYSHPRCNPSDSINSALVYQINYVYKETPTAYLLASVPEIVDIERDRANIKGWVLKTQTTAWNHRLAYEVNWDDDAVAERKSKGVKTKITKNKDGGASVFVEKSSYYNKRDIGEVDRFPVLDVYNGVSKVGVIGDLRSQEGKTLSSTEFANIKHKIDSMSSSLRNINVIFVVDATSSMVPYSKAIQNSIKKTMRQLLKSQNNYRFGIMLYRDASEGKSNTIHYSRDLSSNYNGVISTLSKSMTPTFNRCNNDPEEAVFYGMKKAIERFDPPEGESNFMILIGDAGNHNRTKVTNCSGQEIDDFSNVDEDELVDLMVRKNINLFAYQVHHQLAQDVRPAFDAFRTQTESLMKKIAIKKTPASVGLTEDNVLIKRANDVEIKPDLGIPGYFKKAPDGGNIHPTVLSKELSSGLLAIDKRVNYQLEGISEYLNGKVEGDHAKELANFIKKLEEQNISKEKLDVVFQKNGQVYNIGYAKRSESGMENPNFQDVLLMSHKDLYSIKRSLERLIPNDEQSLSPNESRSYIVYTWPDILVDILGYFPNHDESIDTLSLYTLSAILTGWGGKEKYKDIKLIDVTSPDRFSDLMLFEYLIDWCVTKGHIQSIYEGQNLLTDDFFDDHKWTIFYSYLFNLTDGEVEQDEALVENFKTYFEKYDKEYNDFNASFRIPMGTGSGLKHYWIDSRIFPHQTNNSSDEDLINYLYKDYKN